MPYIRNENRTNKKKNKNNKEKKIKGGPMVTRSYTKWFPLFLLPTVAAFIIGFIYPFCHGIYLSLCTFTTTSDAKD